jgi:hypothetical protein
MKYPTPLRTVATLLILLLGSAACAQTTQPTTQPTTRPGTTVRLLTVGNSFAGNATKYLRDLAAADGNQVILGMANPGGCTLERHWKAVAAYEADPKDAAGQLYVTGPKDNQKRFALYDILVRDKWDYVTIQQASILSDKPDTYFPYAANLNEYITKNAPTATVLIHQTWAYRQDHSRYAKGETPKDMHDAARAAYHAMAAKLDLRLVPVGDAMFTAMTLPDAPFTPDPAFDPATAVHPALPKDRNTLHVGWKWEKDAEGVYHLKRDGTHANARGCYLGSAVFYEFLFGKSVVGNTFVPKELTPEDARLLQQIAHDTVKAARAGVPTTQPTASR